MKHARKSVTLSRCILHVSVLLSVIAGNSDVAHAEVEQLRALGIGTLNARHFTEAHCRFWIKGTNSAPGGNVIIETDFSNMWLNINGRDMRFEAEHASDQLTILQTPAGKIELIEITDMAEESDEPTLGAYQMKVILRPTAAPNIIDLLGRCG